MQTWEPGDVLFNRYEVRSMLGQGGFGQVFLVHHRAWGMDLAVKRPHAELFTQAEAREDFVREAETWVNLGLHPHVASCYFVRILDGVPMLFAEYVNGGDLHNWIDDGRLYRGTLTEAVVRILDISIQMAWGLHHAHQQGFIHRDMKPGNVLSTRAGVAKVTDFGITCSARDLVGRISYTKEYASPEQLNPDALLTQAVDVWCWAVSVAHMFMKHPPYAGLLAWESLQHWLERPRADRLLIPADLVAVLQACLDPDPSRRPTSLLDVADQLQALYTRTTGVALPRRRPAATHGRADVCNNRAVSLLDLDHTAEAQKFLLDAVEADPRHVEAAYNLAMLRWRLGQVTDVQVLHTLQHRLGDDAWSKLMTAWVHLERGDGPSARDLLREVKRLGTLREAREGAEQYVESGFERTQLLEGHTDFVQAVVLAAGGREVISGSDDRTIRVWRVEDGVCLRTLRGHSGAVLSLALATHQPMLWSGSEDGTIRVWDLDSGRSLGSMTGHQGGVRSIAMLGTGDLAISGCDAGSVCLWEPRSSQGRALPDSFGAVRGVALAPDGALFAVATETELSVWDSHQRRALWRRAGPRQAVCFDARGHVLSADEDRVVRVRDAFTGDIRQELVGHDDVCTSLAVASALDRAVSASRDGTCRVWGAHRCLRTLSEDRGWLYAVAMSADGQRFATAGADGKVAVWDMPVALTTAPMVLSRPRAAEEELSNAHIVKDILPEAWAAMERQDWAQAVSLAQQARQVAGYERARECLQVWTTLASHLPRGALREAWPVRSLVGHDGAVTAVALSPDGDVGLSGGADGTLRWWDLTTGTCVAVLREHAAPITGLQVSGAGYTAISIDQRGMVIAWDLANKTVSDKRQTHATLACLTLDERLLLGGPGGLDVGEQYTIETSCSALAISADGTQAATASEDGTVYLWSVSDGQRLGVLSGHTAAVRALAFAADGALLLSAGDDNHVRLFDTRSGQCRRVLKGHKRSITCIGVSHDAQVAVTGAKDRQVRLWDLRSGTCTAQLAPHTDWVLAVAMAPLGRQVLSAGRDGGLHLWYLDWNVQVSSG